MKLETGDCFKNAIYYMSRNKEEGMLLVHGLVLGTGNGIKGVRYVHAWVENDYLVIDPSADLENPRYVKKEIYYSVGKIEKSKTKRYTYDQMSEMLMKHKIFDSWEIERTKEELALLKYV